MENDIALMATGYVFARLGILAAFGYLIYRVLGRKPATTRVRTQSNYATERLHSSRFDR